jgi:tetratricopeptide (TPR) repeat protein
LRKDSLFFGIAGVFFGVLVGWMIGAQYVREPSRTAAPAPAAAPAPQAQTAAPLDEARASRLRSAIEQDPRDAKSRVELANLYFDSERYTEAIQWYEDALRVDPRDANVSTDLGIAYYYTNQPERALAQFERSLEIDPAHTKTLLNVGIVRAFGKQDLEGAATAWQRVIDLAPDSPEAATARRALDGLRSAHPDAGRRSKD